MWFDSPTHRVSGLRCRHQGAGTLNSALFLVHLAIDIEHPRLIHGLDVGAIRNHRAPSPGAGSMFAFNPMVRFTASSSADPPGLNISLRRMSRVVERLRRPEDREARSGAVLCGSNSTPLWNVRLPQ
jgi:hypothetical protein